METSQRQGWDNEAHLLWKSGNQNGAVQQVLKTLNSYGEVKPKASVLQLCYYMYFLNDFASGVQLLKTITEHYPDDMEVLRNLIVFLNRDRKYEEAITYAKQCTSIDPDSYLPWDSLASSYYQLGRYSEAAQAGTQSLLLKDQAHGSKPSDWNLPSVSPTDFTQGKKKVIAFSLWGDNTRYLYGALRNVLLAPDIYPEWELWFYVDNSVPVPYLELIQQLGGKLFFQKENQSTREKLCWRFLVANHPDIGYFLVRDADSVFSPRELYAVQAWIESGQWFHTIRDWWTHTDLVLAGLWGGVAGVLPDIWNKLVHYSSGHMDTPNIDQWFLRDKLWPYIKQSCVMHDRCFKVPGSIPLPGPVPSGQFHIGSCEAVLRPGLQEKILEPWLSDNKM